MTFFTDEGRLASFCWDRYKQVSVPQYEDFLTKVCYEVRKSLTGFSHPKTLIGQYWTQKVLHLLQTEGGAQLSCFSVFLDDIEFCPDIVVETPTKMFLWVAQYGPITKRKKSGNNLRVAFLCDHAPKPALVQRVIISKELHAISGWEKPKIKYTEKDIKNSIKKKKSPSCRPCKIRGFYCNGKISNSVPSSSSSNRSSC